MAVAFGSITRRVCGGWGGQGPGSAGPEGPCSRLVAYWLIGVYIHLNSYHLEHYHL